MKTRHLSALGAVLAVIAAPPAFAQQIVHDPVAYVKAVEEARTALQQLDAMKTQIEQGQALFESLNQLSDVNALASQLGLPTVRNPLPDVNALRAAAEGDLTAMGSLADRTEAIRRQTRAYTPPQSEVATDAAEYLGELERSGGRTARDLALGEAVGRAADERLQGLETLRRGLDTAPNARAVMDLSARLAAEQAAIPNEQVRLQGLAMIQAAEARLEVQRERERAESARAARMQRYRQTFK